MVSCGKNIQQLRELRRYIYPLNTFILYKTYTHAGAALNQCLPAHWSFRQHVKHINTKMVGCTSLIFFH